MTTIDKALELLQAYKEGKILEYLEPYATHWTSVLCLDELLKYLHEEDYEVRIKPEPKYRPFKNAQEFLTASREHYDWLQLIPNPKDGPETIFGANKPVKVLDTGLIFCDKEFYSWETIFTTFCFTDGTPCGILE